MTLYYPSLAASADRLIGRIRELSLAYKMELDRSLSAPELHDGSQKYVGQIAIDAYIDKLEGERHQWYYCDC